MESFHESCLLNPEAGICRLGKPYSLHWKKRVSWLHAAAGWYCFKEAVFGRIRQSANRTIGFVMSARLPVRPHGTTPLPLDGLSWILTFEYFSKICRECSSLAKIWQKWRVLYVKTYVYMYRYFSCRIAGLEVSIRKVLRPATSAQGFLGFLVSVYKRMLRWFPKLQVATACFSCSPPDLNFLVIYIIFMYMHNDHCHRVTVQLQLINIIIIIIIRTEIKMNIFIIIIVTKFVLYLEDRQGHFLGTRSDLICSSTFTILTPWIYAVSLTQALWNILYIISGQGKKEHDWYGYTSVTRIHTLLPSLRSTWITIRVC